MADTPGAAPAGGGAEAPAVEISRLFHARPETVFRAWSSPEHVMRWFSPETYTVSQARVEMRVGGPFEICMRAPTGEEHWMRGVFTEVSQGRRLAIESEVCDPSGAPLFRALTRVTFAEAIGGTRMDVVQTYVFVDPSLAAPMVAGAAEGWRTTLDKLAGEAVRLQAGGDGAVRSVVHGAFRLERTYPAPAARVWRALTDEAAKAAWFGAPPGRAQVLEREMDVRPGGRERVKVRWDGGVVSLFEAVYHDVVPQARLIYGYEMSLDDRKISVSLATMELRAAEAGTTLIVNEQGAFLDGYDDAGSRQEGTVGLLDALGAALAA